MKRKFLQHLVTYAAAGLVCAAVLTGTPDPNPTIPGNAGTIPGIENPEKGENDGNQPGAAPQDDSDRDLNKGKRE